MARYLITTIPQVDGGYRELYAATQSDRREAREALRRDPAMVERMTVSEYVDFSPAGRRERFLR